MVQMSYITFTNYVNSLGALDINYYISRMRRVLTHNPTCYLWPLVKRISKGRINKARNAVLFVQGISIPHLIVG